MVIPAYNSQNFKNGGVCVYCLLLKSLLLFVGNIPLFKGMSFIRDF